MYSINVISEPRTRGVVQSVSEPRFRYSFDGFRTRRRRFLFPYPVVIRPPTGLCSGHLHSCSTFVVELLPTILASGSPPTPFRFHFTNHSPRPLVRTIGERTRRPRPIISVVDLKFRKYNVKFLSSTTRKQRSS